MARNVMEIIELHVSVFRRLDRFACNVNFQMRESSVNMKRAQAKPTLVYSQKIFCWVLAGRKFPVSVIHSIVSDTMWYLWARRSAESHST